MTKRGAVGLLIGVAGAAELVRLLGRKRKLVDAESNEPPPSTGAESDLGDLTQAELYERAKALQIEGRSRMRKHELREAVARAERSGAPA